MVDRLSRPIPLKRCSIAVFAPSPILSIMVEQGLSGPEIHLHAAGQGFWVARMAAQLGADVRLCAPLGGEAGAVLEPLLRDDGVELVTVAVEGENGAYIHDRREGARDEVAMTPSSELHRHELDDLYGVALTAGMEAGTMLLTGPRDERVLPPETYERLSRDLRHNGRFVLADLSGDCLAAALRGGVDLVKVSDEELIAMGWLENRDASATAAAAGRLQEKGAANALVSRGKKGALARIDDRLLEVTGPAFASLDQRGAGDSMFAGVGVALGSGLGIEDALRVGAAAGALNVTRHGLGTGGREEISRVAAAFRVAAFEPDQSPSGGAADGSAATTAS